MPIKKMLPMYFQLLLQQYISSFVINFHAFNPIDKISLICKENKKNKNKNGKCP